MMQQNHGISGRLPYLWRNCSENAKNLYPGVSSIEKMEIREMGEGETVWNWFFIRIVVKKYFTVNQYPFPSCS